MASRRFFLSSCYLILPMWILVVVAFTATAQVPIPRQTTTDSTRPADGKRSTIRGRVVYDDNGKPLRRVEVRLYDPASQSGRHLMDWTDGRGYFLVKNVPSGKYFVNVNGPGTIRSFNFDSQNQPSVAVDGRSDGEITVRVKRGGAISGKITYADGDPVLNASLRIMRRQDGKWHDNRQYTDHCVTDDRGMYRISGLEPGEYVVGASEMKTAVEVMARDDPDGGNFLTNATLTTAYYGGTSNIATATVVLVRAGAEEADINITFPERALRAVSGIVLLRPDSRPVERARLSLYRKEEGAPFNSEQESPVTNSDEQGRFTFDEVPDGNYTLMVSPPHSYERYNDQSSPLPPDNSTKFVNRNIELSIAGSDVVDIVVEVSKGGRISGTVALDGGKPL